MIIALIYKANGEREAVSPKNGKDFKLEQLQKIVGGHIEISQISEDEIMVSNEEGKLLGLPYNQDATYLYQNRFGAIDFIVGDVLVCKKNEVK